MWLTILNHIIFWPAFMMLTIWLIWLYEKAHSTGCGDSMMGPGPVIAAVVFSSPIWILTGIFVPITYVTTICVIIGLFVVNELEERSYYKREMSSKRAGSINCWPGLYEKDFDFRPVPYFTFRFSNHDIWTLCAKLKRKQHKNMLNNPKFFIKIISEDLSFYDWVDLKFIDNSTNDITVIRINTISDAQNINKYNLLTFKITDISEDHFENYDKPGRISRCERYIEYTIKIG